eukprot:270749_1
MSQCVNLLTDIIDMKEWTIPSDDVKERAYCFRYITTIHLQANISKSFNNESHQKISPEIWIKTFERALRLADKERGIDTSSEKYNEWFDDNYQLKCKHYFELLEPLSMLTMQISKKINFNVRFRHFITHFQHKDGYFFNLFSNEFANEIIEKFIDLNIIHDDNEIDIFIENNPQFSYYNIMHSKADLLVHGYVSIKNLGLTNNSIIPATLIQLCLKYFIAEFPSMKNDFDRGTTIGRINKIGRKKCIDLLWSILCPQNDKRLKSLCRYLFDTINNLSSSISRNSDNNRWKRRIIEYFMYFVIASMDVVNFNNVLLDDSDLIKNSLESVAVFKKHQMSRFSIIYLGSLVTYNGFFRLYQYKIRHGDWNISWEIVDALTMLRAFHNPDHYGTMRNIQRIASPILCNDEQLNMVNMENATWIDMIQIIATIMDDISLNSSNWDDICEYRHKIQLSLTWLFSTIENYEIIDQKIQVYLTMIVGYIWRYIFCNPGSLPFDIFDTLRRLKHYDVDITPWNITLDMFIEGLPIIFDNVSHMQEAFDVLSDALENIGDEKNSYMDLLCSHFKVVKLEDELRIARRELIEKLASVRENRR